MTTIGDLEQQAGIDASHDQRILFWMRFHHLNGRARRLRAGVAELTGLVAYRHRELACDETTSGRDGSDRLPPLTPEEQAALQDYAARHGRRWKSVLNNVWMGGPPHDDGGILRYLRNTRGPSWLMSYRLPRASMNEVWVPDKETGV